ncbi:MAG TPA: DUF86 domain-containing protein [Gemmatimonadales bacterium]|nr:DUF86 domain-containing protein [Gemmatimonadales bacterium]
MTELDAGLVRRKLAVIAQNLADLAAVERLSVSAYRADRFRQKGTERLLQEIVEAAVDVNLHLLRSRDVPAPSDYYASFVGLGRHDLIPVPLADRLAPSAGLRKRLVHEYDTIDDALVLRAAGDARRDFAAYLAAVERHVSGLGL